mgnify:CR=1 FL=1
MTSLEFSELRYGMFVHFGLYSVHGKGEWAYGINISPEEYPTLLEKFNPDADWAEQLCVKATCEKQGVSGIEEFGYGKGFLGHGSVGDLLHAVDLDVETLLHGLVALEDGIVDGLGDQLLDGDLTRGPALAVAADDGDLGAVVVQIVGQPIGQLGLRLGLSGGGGDGIGIRGILGVLSAGGKAADQHEQGKESRENTGQFHGVLQRCVFFS